MGNIPERIERIKDLAENLAWVWNPKSRSLFKRLDFPAWASTGHNPVKMLKTIPAHRIEAAAKDPSFLKLYDSVLYDFNKMMEENSTWFSKTYPAFNGKIAYISTEFGLHQSLPIYSGGLGELSGGHVKESSELGVPLIGTGFVYPQGYFKQLILRNGWQEAHYKDIIFEDTPINPVYDETGAQLYIEVKHPKPIFIRVWKLNVGRIPLYLMDTDCDKNQPWDRGLSARLYGGDQEMRIRQEIVLGFGAVKILSYLGYQPKIFHLNEGHTAFVALELLREELQENGMSFEEAKENVRKRIIFTTHTPVEAGHDQFPFELVSKYFQSYWENLGITRDQFLGLGAFDWKSGEGPRFNMTVLGMRFSRYQNAVSKLNGEVCRNMWKRLYETQEFHSRPIIDSITNGVHLSTWMAGPVQKLFTKYLGKSWLSKKDDPEIWERIDDIPDEELWNTRLLTRRNMFSFLRETARAKRIFSGKDSRQTLASGALLDPDALTIGFARRFATYKRADLIFKDLERLKNSILDAYTPVQIIFAGKAHPADDPGKHILQKVYQKATDPFLGGRIAFVEGFDLQVARYLVQGCDVWLNTPRKPMEASGTSGMKAAINGAINFSVDDGWWKEAYNGSNGWVIGSNDFKNPTEQDDHDAKSFYEILENEVRPLFYSRNNLDIPTDWCDLIRNSIKTVAPSFSATRMVKEYVTAYMR